MKPESQAKKKAAIKQPFSPSDSDLLVNDILYMNAGFMLAIFMEQKISQLLYEAEAEWNSRLSNHLDRLMEKFYDESE